MIKFNNTYITLPENFYSKEKASKASNPSLIEFNNELAEKTLGIDLKDYDENELAKIFTGQKILEGSSPIAMAYAGHQFGHFVPQLGDGRALLLGEIISPKGKRYDIQLKGSGPTKFSRRGDGKSSLGPVIREFIVSEAMHHLGVPSTRALAAATTGDMVFRELPLPGGVFTRIASSHLRIGTFEYFASRNNVKDTRTLLDYAINRHYPDIAGKNNSYLLFLEKVAEAHASMIANWMSLGFIHGVMNTDNMSISGETIDFGPCAFMENFSKRRVFSSIDRNGRYAYNNQMEIGKWNLYRLAECLIPLMDGPEKKVVEVFQEKLEKISENYDIKYLEKMRGKFGLFTADKTDEDIVKLWFDYMESEDLDFTLSFNRLSDSNYKFKENDSFNKFNSLWNKRLEEQSQDSVEADKLMKKVNPVFIPRNHNVEKAIQGAINGNYGIFRQMNEFLKTPYTDNEKFAEFKLPAKPEERVCQTFCGT